MGTKSFAKGRTHRTKQRLFTAINVAGILRWNRKLKTPIRLFDWSGHCGRCAWLNGDPDRDLIGFHMLSSFILMT